MPIKLSEKDGWLRFEVHAKPRAKKSCIVGPRGEAVEIALAAPPVDGAANEELIKMLSKALGVPKRNLQLVRGETSHTKLVAVFGIDSTSLLQLLGGKSAAE